MKTTKNKLFVFGVFHLLSSCSHGKRENEDVDKPKYNGYVPDAVTAERVAEAIWLPIYGPSVLDEKPYKTKIVGDSVWIVEGILGNGKVGGTAYIEVRVKDCAVLKVTHGK